MFKDDERVRALNSQLLLSDTLQGREQQIEVKEYIKDVEKRRDQFYQEETLEQMRKHDEEEQRKK